MLGEAGVILDWSDRLTDKCWSHYAENEKTKHGVVVFLMASKCLPGTGGGRV